MFYLARRRAQFLKHYSVFTSAHAGAPNLTNENLNPRPPPRPPSILEKVDSELFVILPICRSPTREGLPEDLCFHDFFEMRSGSASAQPDLVHAAVSMPAGGAAALSAAPFAASGSGCGSADAEAKATSQAASSAAPFAAFGPGCGAEAEAHSKHRKRRKLENREVIPEARGE